MPLTSVDELKKIFGWAEYTSHPGWDKDFTTIINGCAQGIDPAYASRDVLRAFGIPDDFVDRFLQARAGPDGLDGTPDDPPMDQGMASSLLGVGPAGAATGKSPQATAIGPFKSSNVFRIVSVGRSGNVSRSVEMIVQKQVAPGGVVAGVGATIAAGRPQVLSWKEL
jgi:hypothetical protein